MNKANSTIKKAVDSGMLKVVNGEVYYNGKKRKLRYCKLVGNYTRVTVNIYSDGVSRPIFVSRLVAYIKYGDKIFEKGIQVRHLDGDSTNNDSNNIAIGTQSENMMDKPEEERIRLAHNALKYYRKFNDKQLQNIREFYRETRSYKQTMEKFNIVSKGTLNYIIHTNYVELS